MRPVVVTAVLLLVVYVQDSVTLSDEAGQFFCRKLYPEKPCGDGWRRVDDKRCIKYFKNPKTFNDAREHCRTLNADLVSVHSMDQSMNLLCLTLCANIRLQTFWIGGQRSGDQFVNTDGTQLENFVWYTGKPDNAGGDENCVESNYGEWGHWNDVNCSEEKNFVCAKNM